MGEQIKFGRKNRKWTEKNLAERAGISRATLQKIERGEMTCVIGSVLEVAALVGVNLFESEKLPLSMQTDQIRDKSVFLPRRIKASKKIVNDDF